MRRTRLVLAMVAASLTLSACDFDVYQLPLPGGTDTGDDPITVTVQFRDVLDLVPKSTVKLNEVDVGKVTDIELDGTVAEVTLELRGDTDLPDEPLAEIRQTSLLGEKFVSLSAPADGGSGELGDGDVIPLDRTGRNPEVEEVLGALSLVLNGGGVAQLKTITQELNLALEGREDAAKSVLTQVDTLVGTLDDNKADIVDAIARLNDLALAVRGQQDDINLALDELPTALVSLDRQREDLVSMLQALDRLGDVGVRVIRRTKQDTIATLTQLQPVLTELADSGDAFVKAFNVFLTYPFVDEVVGRDPQVARNLHMGDYTNLDVQLEIDLSGGITGVPTELPTVLPTDLDPTKLLGDVAACLQSGSLTSDACKKVLATPEKLLRLQEVCLKKKNKKTVVCQIINANLPGLPNLGGGGGGGEGGGGLPELPIVGGLLRPGFDPERGPTMAELAAIYDEDLVTLLVPGMVAR